MCIIHPASEVDRPQQETSIPSSSIGPFLLCDKGDKYEQMFQHVLPFRCFVSLTLLCVVGQASHVERSVVVSFFSSGVVL